MERKYWKSKLHIKVIVIIGLSSIRVCHRITYFTSHESNTLLMTLHCISDILLSKVLHETAFRNPTHLRLIFWAAFWRRSQKEMWIWTSKACLVKSSSSSYFQHHQRHVSTIWQYRLWSFKFGYTKLARFLSKNQHTQR